MNAPSQNLRVLLIDDERLASKLLAELLAAHHELEIVGQAASFEEASILTVKLQPEVVFLDIQMPRRNGFDLTSLFSTMPKPPLVVFVTAHEQHAVRAFEVAAIDYLLKPVHPKRLARTVERLVAASRMHPAQTDVAAPPSNGVLEAIPDSRTLRLGADDLEMLRDGREIRLVKASQIRAIQTEGSYTRLLFEANSSSMVKLPLAHWESRLPESLFFKASRSLLLNVPSILRFESQGRNRTHLFLSGVSKPLVLSRLETFRLRREIQRLQQARGSQNR